MTMHKILKMALVFTAAFLTVACGDNPDSTPGNAPPAAIQAPSTVDASALHRDALRVREAGDFAKAFDLFNQAATAGDRDAMFFLGVMYEHGESVDVNYEKAIEWYTKSDALGCGS